MSKTSRDTARRAIDAMLQRIRSEAAAAGLTLSLNCELKNPEQEKFQARLQANLNTARGALEAAAECAKELGLDRIVFMDLILKWDHEGHPFEKGIGLFEEWNASSVDCHPSDRQWKQLHGDDPPGKP